MFPSKLFSAYSIWRQLPSKFRLVGLFWSNILFSTYQIFALSLLFLNKIVRRKHSHLSIEKLPCQYWSWKCCQTLFSTYSTVTNRCFAKMCARNLPIPLKLSCRIFTNIISNMKFNNLIALSGNVYSCKEIWRELQ